MMAVAGPDYLDRIAREQAAYYGTTPEKLAAFMAELADLCECFSEEGEDDEWNDDRVLAALQWATNKVPPSWPLRLTSRRKEEQDLRIELMGAQLELIRFEMEQARRDADSRQQRNEQLAREEDRRFWIQVVVTSIAGLAVAAALLVHLMDKIGSC